MNQQVRTASAPIRLADEADFSIGTMQVRPSRGEVEARREITRLEPRLMQVLIALAQSNGDTVSRDELVARCWSGTLVSPDAVNRVISLLRRLLETSAPAAAIETLPRIGYRLVQADAPAVGRPLAGAPLPRETASVVDDPLVRDLFTRAMVSIEQPSREPLEQALAYLKEAVARAPGFAEGWAALGEAQRLLMLYLPAPMQGPARADSSRSVERAIAIDPELGQAYGTLANLIPRFNNWTEVETLFEKGIAKASTTPGLFHAYAQFLLSAGRTSEAVERLIDLRRRNPLSAGVAIDLAAALLDIGRESEAIAAVEQAYSLWPGIMLVWSECVRMNVVVGRYERGQALLDAPPATVAPDDPNLARRRLHLIAKRDRRPVDMAAARKNFLDFSRIGIAPATIAIHALSTLDQADAAFGVAEEIFRLGPPQAQAPGVNMMGTYTLAGQPDSTVLFRRDTTNLRRLPELASIIERVGLEEYWRESGCRPFFRVEEY